MRYFLSACVCFALPFIASSPASGAPFAPASVSQAPSAVVATGGRVAVVGTATNGSSVTNLAVQGLAASQVASTGRQSVRLGKDGAATGGTMFASSLKGDYIVPQNVQAILDFSNGVPMSANSFVNNGTVYCVSNNTNVAHAAINVKSFLNAPNAQLLTSLALSINSKTSFINYGTIATSDDLAISATTSLANFGTLRSTNGNLALTGTSSAFAVGNAGYIYAPNGTITIDQRSTTRNNLEINGGQWTARTININAPSSKVHFFADDISGQVNVASNGLQIGAVWNAPNLGIVPAHTTILSAKPAEALPVCATATRFDDADYVADTSEDFE